MSGKMRRGYCPGCFVERVVTKNGRIIAHVCRGRYVGIGDEPISHEVSMQLANRDALNLCDKYMPGFKKAWTEQRPAKHIDSERTFAAYFRRRDLKAKPHDEASGSTK